MSVMIRIQGFPLLNYHQGILMYAAGNSELETLGIVQQWKPLNSYHSRHRLSSQKTAMARIRFFPAGTRCGRGQRTSPTLQVCNEGHIFIDSETPAIFQVHVSPRPLFPLENFLDPYYLVISRLKYPENLNEKR